MKIYRATRTNVKTQLFGLENTSPPMIKGYQSLGLLGHNGWDTSLYYKEPVYFDVDTAGKVIEASIDAYGGLGLVILTEDTDGRFYKHYYWHFAEFKVKCGDIVKTGDLIGLGDSTGWSTGNHLHRGVKECNKDGTTLNYSNGYLGAIDLAPFYQEVFVVDYMNNLKAQVSILQKLVELFKNVILLR